MFTERRKLKVEEYEWKDGRRKLLISTNATIEIIIDLDKIAEGMGRRAVLSKGGKARHGHVIVKHVRVRHVK